MMQLLQVILWCMIETCASDTSAEFFKRVTLDRQDLTKIPGTITKSEPLYYGRHSVT